MKKFEYYNTEGGITIVRTEDFTSITYELKNFEGYIVDTQLVIESNYKDVKDLGIAGYVPVSTNFDEKSYLEAIYQEGLMKEKVTKEKRKNYSNYIKDFAYDENVTEGEILKAIKLLKITEDYFGDFKDEANNVGIYGEREIFEYKNELLGEYVRAINDLDY